LLWISKVQNKAEYESKYKDTQNHNFLESRLHKLILAKMTFLNNKNGGEMVELLSRGDLITRQLAATEWNNVPQVVKQGAFYNSTSPNPLVWRWSSY
jgi:hypothetical protein